MGDILHNKKKKFHWWPKKIKDWNNLQDFFSISFSFHITLGIMMSLFTHWTMLKIIFSPTVSLQHLYWYVTCLLQWSAVWCCKWVASNFCWTLLMELLSPSIYLWHCHWHYSSTLRLLFHHILFYFFMKYSDCFLSLVFNNLAMSCVS